MSLYEKALATSLASRFQARADDMNRRLTDEEVRDEARYQLDDLPYKGWAKDEVRIATREMKRLLKITNHTERRTKTQ